VYNGGFDRVISTDLRIQLSFKCSFSVDLPGTGGSVFYVIFIIFRIIEVLLRRLYTMGS
jgi:hypothetical protein